MAFTYITGSGTQATPYTISNQNGLVELRDWVNAGNTGAGLYFILIPHGIPPVFLLTHIS